MSTVRNAVKMYFRDSTSYTMLDRLYHPDFAFNKYDLYWNSGLGYRTSQCINAQGNGNFINTGRSFYIGSGRPDEAQESTMSGMLASQLVGMDGGLVDPDSNFRKTLANYWRVSEGGSFTEYDRSVSVNNQTLGYVGLSMSSGTTVYGSALSWKAYTSISGMVVPNAGNFANVGNYPYPFAQNGGFFVGWWNGSVESGPAFLNGDYSLTAVFGIRFYVEFNANGGSGAVPEKKYYVYGVEEYKPQGNIGSVSFSRNGYSFVGLNTSPDGSGVWIKNSESATSVYEKCNTSPDGTVTLYAVWASVKLRKRGTGDDSDTNVDDVGTLVVKSSEDGYENPVDIANVQELVTVEGLDDDAPYDAQVKYVKGTGNGSAAGPYVMTDFKLMSTDVVEAKFAPGANLTESHALWCARGTSTTDKSMSAFLIGSKVRHDLNAEQTSISEYTAKNATPFVIRSDGRNVYIDGILVATHSKLSEFTTPGNVALFVGYTMNSAGSYTKLVTYSNCYLYYFNVIRDGEYIHALVPVRFANESGTSEGALYDLVTKKLYRNSGTGSLSIGPNANPKKISTSLMFAPQPNTSYRVSCELGTDAPDKFWAFGGISSNDPSLIDSNGSIVIGATLSSRVVNANFVRRVIKNVTTGTQAEAGSFLPDEIEGATLAITAPPEPDVIAPGQAAPYGYGQYLTGQTITATAQIPDGVLGWELRNARLQVGGVTDDPIPNYVHGDRIDIPSSVFLNDIRIIGVFGRIDCEVDAKADDPSDSVVSGVDVKRYSSLDGDWIRATSVKYGETVRVYATVNTSLGYELDGIYANGEKIADSLSQDGYVECVVRGETHFVVKAKVRVSLGVGHWNVDDGTWADGDCFVSASVEGVDIESPADGFDVILGQTVAYSVDIRGGWHFDAWFAGTEAEKPESFDDPVDLPISETEFVPTKPVSVIARVTDSVISYETNVSFANNDNPQAVVDIPADVANVTSFPEADDVGISQNKVVLTYSSGTKPVTLTFSESIGSLYFEKLQELVRGEWTDVEVVGTEYPILTSKNRTLRALYTTSGERTVKVAYANIPNVSSGTEDRVCGEIGIVESNYPEGGPDGKTFVGSRGTQFTLRVVAKNGWRFVGWFYDPAHIGVQKYEGTETVVSVISTRTLYAYFEPDTHAIYEWEGRNENKMMTWRSKVYVSPVPFNPSGVRVDATDVRGRGTDVSRVEVGMMSSPDAVPAQSGLTVLTNMPNYVARRLPKRRPERYMYVEVQNDAEVDRVIVGTSIEGLKV